MPKKAKKAKKPSYERPSPWVSPERGRYYAPTPTKSDGYSLVSTNPHALKAFMGTLHTPFWTDPAKDDVGGKKVKSKNKGGKKGKAKAEPQKAKDDVVVGPKIDWSTFNKSHLVNTYLVNPRHPPWSNPPNENMCIPKFAYRNQSKGSCNLGCGACGFTKKQRTKHEAEECPERTIECPAGCGVSGIRPTTVEAHLERSCPLMPVTCKWKCGRVQAQALISMHEPKCNYCPCECRLECGIKGLILMTRQPHEDDVCPERIVSCPDCYEKMKAKLLAMHMKNICPHRFVPPCKWGCGFAGQRMPTMEKHEESECPLRPTECKFGCGAEGLQGWRMERHYESCPERQAPCPRCHQLIFGKDKAAHDGQFIFGRVPVCDQLFIPCPLGCGETILFSEQQSHFSELCSHAKVGCRQCGTRMRRIDRAIHDQKDCPYRMVACGLACGARLMERERLLHQSTFCPQRIVQCRVRQQDGSIGCGIHTLKACERKEHEKFEEKQIKDEEDKRRLFEDACTRVESVACPRGCGIMVKPREMARHLDLTCKERIKKLSTPGTTFGVAVKARCVDIIDYGMRGKVPPTSFGVDAALLVVGTKEQQTNQRRSNREITRAKTALAVNNVGETSLSCYDLSSDANIDSPNTLMSATLSSP